MSYAERSQPARDDQTTPRSFELVRRGYDKQQVDRYVARVDGEVSNLSAERDWSRKQVQELTAQLEQTRAEVTELRERPPQVDRATFRDLGPTVDQILALAEHQAGTITDLAAQRAAAQQAEAEQVLADARQHAEGLRAESEAMYKQEIQSRRQVLAQVLAELDSNQQQLAQARQDGATAEHELNQLRQRHEDVSRELATELQRLDEARQAADSAERHATEVRARVQREAERVAQLAAAAVMAAAARGAETGEYPVVMPPRSHTNGTADGTPDETVAPSAGTG